MEKNTFQRELKVLIRWRNLLFLTTLVLSAALFALFLAGPKTNEKIIVVPTTSLRQDFWLTNTSCSQDYLEEIGLFLANHLFTKSTADAEAKNAIVLKHVHPKRFHAIKAALVQEEKTLREKNQALFFHPTEVEVDVKAGNFFLSGTQKIYLDKKNGVFVDAYPVSYCLTFQLERGQIFLVQISQPTKETFS